MDGRKQRHGQDRVRQPRAGRLLPCLPCRHRQARLTALLAALLPTLAVAQSWDVDWHTIDGGGEVLAETAGGQWQLSGTLGQWDATQSQAASGVGWTLTGGFWPATVAQADPLFSDGFED